MYERDRHKDRQTDRHRMTAKVALDAIIARQKLLKSANFWLAYSKNNKNGDVFLGHIKTRRLSTAMFRPKRHLADPARHCY